MGLKRRRYGKKLNTLRENFVKLPGKHRHPDVLKFGAALLGVAQEIVEAEFGMAKALFEVAHVATEKRHYCTHPFSHPGECRFASDTPLMGACNNGKAVG